MAVIEDLSFICHVSRGTYSKLCVKIGSPSFYSGSYSGDRLKRLSRVAKKLQFFDILAFQYCCTYRVATIKDTLGDIQKGIKFARMRSLADAMDRFTGWNITNLVWRQQSMRFSGRLLQKLKLQCNHHAIKTGWKEHNTPKLSKYLQLYTEYKFSIHALC